MVELLCTEKKIINCFTFLYAKNANRLDSVNKRSLPTLCVCVQPDKKEDRIEKLMTTICGIKDFV